jgi:hypothetical protein
VPSQILQLVVLIGHRLSSQRGLQEPLRNKIRVPTAGGGGMGIPSRQGQSAPWEKLLERS